MFDWNDEELVNIIWGEADESDDHIVPYPDGSEERTPDLFGNHIKKEWNEEAANVKPTEQKKPVAKCEPNVGKQEKNSQYDTNEGLPAAGLGVDSWIDLSLSNASKLDQASMDETARLDNCSQNEEKEDSDLVDYGWANIGSFDDLDRIFSNGDPVFGHANLENADELWSSSKDITSSPDKSVDLSVDFSSLGSTALGSPFEHYGKGEYMLDQDQPFGPGYEKVNDLTCNVPENVQSNMNQLGHADIKKKLFVKDKIAMEMVSKTLPFNSNLGAGTVATSTEFADKMSRQRKLLKSRKKSEGEKKARQLQDLFSSWSASGNQFLQFDSQYTQIGQASPSLGINQQMQLQGPECLQYMRFSSPLLAPSVHQNVGNQDPATPVLPRFHSRESNRKVPPGSEVSPHNLDPLSKFPDTPVNPLAMTPQEKIEKLRRRQQMRAMLAIQKQQKQFSHQTSGSEHSMSQKYSNADRMQLVGGNVEVDDRPSTLHSIDPNSPTEQDNPGTISMVDNNCSLEDAILYRLQDIVAKLDIQLRLCIRDSLFRLAQSAMKRQYAKDTSSTNKSSRDDLEFLAKQEETDSNTRFARMSEVETDTNPIDRTVAHLLFHRPLELTGKLPETPKSPASAKLPFQRVSTTRGVLPENFKIKDTQCDLVSKYPSANAEGENSKSRSSNCEAGHGGATEVEDS